MKKIMDGLNRFQSEIFPLYRELFERLSTRQSPEVLFITCADSRIAIHLITQSEPGDIFICRNAGNIAPPHGVPGGGVAATIEYAVMVLKVHDIILCGHTDCGAVKALLHPEKLVGLPGVTSWLQHAERARAVAMEKYPDLGGDELVNRMVEENVVTQLNHLRTHPCVAAREEKGELNLHGWVYEIETSRVRAYDPARRSFVDITEARLASSVAAGDITEEANE